MKKIAIGFIAFYQDYVSLFLRHMLGMRDACRFIPSCSQYTKSMIEKKGVVAGSFLGIKRILSCSPLYGKFTF